VPGILYYCNYFKCTYNHILKPALKYTIGGGWLKSWRDPYLKVWHVSCERVVRIYDLIHNLVCNENEYFVNITMCKGLTVMELLYGRATRKFVGFMLLYSIMTCVLCLTAIAQITYTTCTIYYTYAVGNDCIIIFSSKK
jgi:hypothetical protein